MANVHILWSWCFQSAEEMIRGTGLRRSKFGNSVISALNRTGRLRLWFYFRLKKQPVTVQGQQMFCRTWEGGSFRSTIELLLDRYEPETTELFHRLLEPGMTVVDVGAHGGYFSLIAASRVGEGGKVYAFEPHAETFKALARNIELNGHKNIYAVHKAVTDRTGSTTMLLHPKGSDRHSLYPSEGANQSDGIEVETTTLDDFMRKKSWPQVDLVKMDIEGAEPAALKGMEQMLQQCGTRFLITEFSPPTLKNAGFEPQSFLRSLSDKGFSLFLLGGEKRSKPLTSEDFPVLIGNLEDAGGTNLLCQRVAEERA